VIQEYNYITRLLEQCYKSTTISLDCWNSDTRVQLYH